MLDRAISKTNLLLLSAGGMIGSSWLFSPFISAKIAGPFALYAWILATLLMLFIALPLCELGTIFPMAGGMVNYPSITHGPGLAFIFGWITWLAYVVCAPIEVQAVMQYASYYCPWLVDTSKPGFHLSMYGFIASFFILFIVMMINSLGVKIFSHCNRYISVFKFIVPTLAIIGFFTVAPSFHHHIELQVPQLNDWSAIFSALSFGGIAFAFTGFQNGLLMAGEVKNPNTSIPLSILGAVAIGFVMYFSLQWSFLAAVPDSSLIKGWHELSFSGQSSPLVGLAMLLGLGWIASLLMIDASVSPLGSSLVFSGVTARILYAMGKNGEIPQMFASLNRYKVPFFALMINFFVGIFSFMPFSGWQDMVVFLSSCSILSYLIGPICLYAISEHHPQMRTGFYLPKAKLICFMSFYSALLMLLWCGFTILLKLSIAISLGMILNRTVNRKGLPLKNLLWISGLMSTMLLISYLSGYGGIHKIAFPIDLICLMPVSYFFLKSSQFSAFNQQIDVLPEHIRMHFDGNSGKMDIL
jgi:amino acid transporter